MYMLFYRRYNVFFTGISVDYCCLVAMHMYVPVIMCIHQLAELPDQSHPNTSHQPVYLHAHIARVGSLQHLFSVPLQLSNRTPETVVSPATALSCTTVTNPNKHMGKVLLGDLRSLWGFRSFACNIGSNSWHRGWKVDALLTSSYRCSRFQHNRFH